MSQLDDLRRFVATRVERARSVPPPYDAIIARAIEQDRQYFLDNPRARLYRRGYVPGEAWPHRLPQSTTVWVIRIDEDLQLRMFELPEESSSTPADGAGG